MNIKIMIASHKQYHMPTDDIYIPVRVGSKKASEDFGYTRDDSGDNISEKNPFFCELTAIYWGWKNLDADYVGLAHYRRHFSCKKTDWKYNSIMTSEQASKICEKYDVIVPKKRRYVIETLFSHYMHTHDVTHLELTREIIKDRHPEYLKSFDQGMKRRSAHMFNMFVMKKDVFDKYCTWLFDILFELEKMVDTSQLSPFDARLFGRVSELLLDVWLMHNNIKYKEVGFVQLGDENWVKKIKSFIFAKFIGKKYDQSR